MHKVETAGVRMIAASSWPVPAAAPADVRGRRCAAHLLTVAAAHALALWLVVNGAHRIAPQQAQPPIVAHLVPPPEQPAPKERLAAKPRPTDPVARSSILTPAPDVITADAPTADVVAAPTDTPGTPDSTEPSGATAEPPSAEPRGFGSILNRDACLAAFRAAYPREARRLRQSGSVTIAARISADGRVLHAEVISAQPRRVFDRAALNVLNSGACRFDSDLAGYAWQADIVYRLDGDVAD